MSKKYYHIRLYEDYCIYWQVLEDNDDYNYPTVVADGVSENMFEALKAARKERNKYVGEKSL